MKFRKLIAIGLSAAMTASALPAHAVELIYNGEWIMQGVEIVNDRAMADFTVLERIGINAVENNGVWSFSKGENTITYNEKTGELSGKDGRIETDAAPIFTSNEKLMPIRVTAESLGAKVGWDETTYWYDAYESATAQSQTVIINDFDAYFEKLKTENPEVYKLLTVRMREADKGASKMDMAVDFKLPGDEMELTLKLVGTGGIADGVSSASMTLEQLDIASPDFKLALADVTLDGIYDINTSTFYFKTNAIEKIKAAYPSQAELLDSISTLMPGDTWYKFTMEEYFALLGEIAGVQPGQDNELFDTIMKQAYGEGIQIGELLRSSAEMNVDDENSFDVLTACVSGLQMMIDSGVIKIESEGENNLKFSFKLDKQSMIDMMLEQYKAWYENADASEEFLPSLGTPEERRADIEADLPETLDITIMFDVKDGVAENAEVAMKIAGDGTEFSMEMHSALDVNAEVTPQTVPENAQNLIPLLDSLMKLSGVSADGVQN